MIRVQEFGQMLGRIVALHPEADDHIYSHIHGSGVVVFWFTFPGGKRIYFVRKTPDGVFRVSIYSLGIEAGHYVYRRTHSDLNLVVDNVTEDFVSMRRTK